MADFDVKTIITEAVDEVLEDLKNKAGSIIKEYVVPAVSEAKENFITKLKEEISTTSSIWVKVRNVFIIVVTSILSSFCTKVVDKITESE